jgi:hypothetical protein
MMLYITRFTYVDMETGEEFQETWYLAFNNEEELTVFMTKNGQEFLKNGFKILQISYTGLTETDNNYRITLEPTNANNNHLKEKFH